MISSEAITSTATPLLPSISPSPVTMPAPLEPKTQSVPTERASADTSSLRSCRVLSGKKNQRQIRPRDPRSRHRLACGFFDGLSGQLFLRLPDSSSNHDSPL